VESSQSQKVERAPPSWREWLQDAQRPGSGAVAGTALAFSRSAPKPSGP